MPETKTTQPTQNLVEVKDIKDGIVYLKNGQIVQIIMVNGINFDLKSEEEQNSIIANFQKFLNSLDFKVQFFIHSRKINIQSYLDKMEERKKNEPNELLKIQIDEYINFIKSFIEQNAIISKNFFVVISYPLSNIEETIKNPTGIFSFLRQNKKTNQEKVDEALQKSQAIQQLHIRGETVIRGLEQIGLKAVPLEDDELIELFYNLYNPQLIEKKGVTFK